MEYVLITAFLNAANCLCRTRPRIRKYFYGRIVLLDKQCWREELGSLAYQFLKQRNAQNYWVRSCAAYTQILVWEIRRVGFGAVFLHWFAALMVLEALAYTAKVEPFLVGRVIKSCRFITLIRCKAQFNWARSCAAYTQILVWVIRRGGFSAAFLHWFAALII